MIIVETTSESEAGVMPGEGLLAETEELIAG
jgi:hypothetical protein